MGRLVVVNFTSIDGVIQSPLFADEDDEGGFSHGGWVVPYSDDTVAAFMRDTTVAAAGMLVGRRSYQILADAWSHADESEPAVAAMNHMPKYVVTRSGVPLDWVNSHCLDGDLLVFGSGTLIRGLAEAAG